MITPLLHLFRLLPVLGGSYRHLALENLALRQQLAVYKRTLRRPKLHPSDRLFWVSLSRIWAGWRQALIIVTPDTVLRWHRRRFRDYWAKLSRRSQVGRPSINAEIMALVRKMAAANPLWVRDLVSIDFFTVATAQLRVLFVLVVLAHHRRGVLHFNVTAHPTAAWTAQQIVDTFPDDTAPSYLLRDRDAIYGDSFANVSRACGSKKSSRPLVVRGRIRSPNALSARLGATVSTTSSSSASATCVTS